MTKERKASPDYPQGKHTVTFTNLDEDDWWLIIHAFQQRIQAFEERQQHLIKLNDPDLVSKETEWYQDSIQRLKARLESFQTQISPVFFKRKEKEKMQRMRQPNV